MQVELRLTTCSHCHRKWNFILIPTNKLFFSHIKPNKSRKITLLIGRDIMACNDSIID